MIIGNTPVLVHNCGNFDADDADGFWSREVEVDGKTMELGGQVSRNGDTLRIDGLMIYSKGVPGDQLDKIGVSGVNALKQQAIAWAKEDGIATITLPGKRHTPGKPRRDFSFKRGQGLSIVQSTIVYARRQGLSMSDAKEIVAESDVWIGTVVQHSNFHDTLESSTDAE